MDWNDVYFMGAQVAASIGVPAMQIAWNFREKKCGMPVAALGLIALNLSALILRGVKHSDWLLITIPSISLGLTLVVILQAWIYRKR